MENIGHGGKEIIERVLPKDAAIKRVAETEGCQGKGTGCPSSDGNRGH